MVSQKLFSHEFLFVFSYPFVFVNFYIRYAEESAHLERTELQRRMFVTVSKNNCCIFHIINYYQRKIS